MRQPKLIVQRIDAIKTAVALTDDEGVIQPFALLVTALAEQLRATLHAIETFDQEIADRAPAHPDFSIFDSFPAAGPVFAPRLLTAFGERRQRFPSPNDLQRYAGVAPCPTFLRQTFVEWAALTIPRSFWAAAYYRQQRAKGKTHQAALRALAYRWIRILHRCWRTGQKYDESIYLNALKQRGSSLLKHIAADPQTRCKSLDGSPQGVC